MIYVIVENDLDNYVSVPVLATYDKAVAEEWVAMQNLPPSYYDIYEVEVV